MKIIHTSDWHLGHRLYNYDRTDEEEHFLSRLASVAGEEQPDVLIVGGDVFDAGAPGNDVAKRFTDGLLAVAARCPGMATVVIAGNHDSYSRLEIDEALWRRSGVRVFGRPAEDTRGFAVFDGNIVEIPGKGIVAAVPFCHPRNFPAVAGANGDDRAENYFKGLAERVAERSGGLPAVLAAHLAVAGNLDLRGHDRNFVVGGEECVDAAGLGAVYSYIALGHIHCPQHVRGTGSKVRYCGTPYAIRFDESYPHGVDVVEVAAGLPPVIRTVPLEPLHRLVTIGGEDGSAFNDALDALTEIPPPEGSFIRLNVRLAPGELPGADWTERARKACNARNLCFCVINPVRTACAGGTEGRRHLAVSELRNLPNDEVLGILSSRHELSARQRELVKSLMAEIPE